MRIKVFEVEVDELDKIRRYNAAGAHRARHKPNWPHLEEEDEYFKSDLDRDRSRVRKTAQSTLKSMYVTRRVVNKQ